MSKIISRLFLGAIAIITLLAYYTSYFGWTIYFELLSHFQVQYFILSLLLLGGLCFLGQKKHIFIGCFFCAVLSLPTLTWYLPANFTDISFSQKSDLKILIANVNAQNRSYDKVLSLVQEQQPDLAIFMEVDRQGQAQLDSLKNLFPYSSGNCNTCNIGIVVYSKQLLEDSRIESFGKDKNSSVIARLTIAQQPLTLIATHPLPPIKPSFFQSRNEQMNLIAQYIKEVDNPLILAGDLNMSMWSPYYRQLVNRTNLNNTRKGFGIIPSWPTSRIYQPIPQGLDLLLNIPIDHCLVSKGIKTTNIYTGSEIGSDHLPLIVDLAIAT